MPAITAQGDVIELQIADGGMPVGEGILGLVVIRHSSARVVTSRWIDGQAHAQRN
jgi:hypothetical protein